MIENKYKKNLYISCLVVKILHVVTISEY